MVFMFEQEAGMLTEVVNKAEGVATTGNQYLSDGTKGENKDAGNSPTNNGNKQCNYQQSPGY